MAARRAYYSAPGSAERAAGMDFLWFLWAGRQPIFGRDRMTTFERRFLADESTWTEPKNVYYQLYNDPEICEALLREFGLEGPTATSSTATSPSSPRKGEPHEGGGRLLVIDGGFCKAYQQTTGIAGYTLIYNSPATAWCPTSPSWAGRRPSAPARTSPPPPWCSSGWSPG
ncbi:MAG: fructose-bisphosphatase class III [Flavonifractor plautii]